MSKQTTIPIEVLPIEEDGFHLLIQGKINGKEARLLIDTGASRTVFDEERITQFPGIQSETFEEMEKLSSGLGTSTMKSHTADISKIELGELVLEDYQGVLINMTHVNKSYEAIDLPPIDGVLGGDILVQYKATIDYNKRELLLTF